jgi:hypothetical protein
MIRCPRCGFRLGDRIKRKRPKQSYRRGEHEYLVGILAHTRRRLEIFHNAGGEATWFDEKDLNSVEEIKPAICQGCVEPHFVGWLEGHWHHNVKSHGGKRCDCAACALYVCEIWHAHFHNRVIGGRRREPWRKQTLEDVKGMFTKEELEGTTWPKR